MLVVLESQIEKVPRGIRGEKSSKDKTSSSKLVSTIGAQARALLLNLRALEFDDRALQMN